MVNNGDIVGFSGFTPAGCPKVVPTAIAKRAEAAHAEGKPFKIGMYTGASTGDSLDGALARANAVEFRTPYQSSKDMRNALNRQDAHYFDMHLSHLAQELRYGFMPKPKFAIVEAPPSFPPGYRIGQGVTGVQCIFFLVLFQGG